MFCLSSVFRKRREEIPFNIPLHYDWGGERGPPTQIACCINFSHAKKLFFCPICYLATLPISPSPLPPMRVCWPFWRGAVQAAEQLSGGGESVRVLMSRERGGGVAYKQGFILVNAHAGAMKPVCLVFYVRLTLLLMVNNEEQPFLAVLTIEVIPAESQT